MNSKEKFRLCSTAEVDPYRQMPLKHRSVVHWTQEQVLKIFRDVNVFYEKVLNGKGSLVQKVFKKKCVQNVGTGRKLQMEILAH